MGKIVGDNIKKILNTNHISQKDLANKLNINETRLSRYISGEREIKPDFLASIATALKTTSDYLLGIECGEFDFANIKTTLARNANLLSNSEKKQLVDVIYDDIDIVKLSDKSYEEIKNKVAMMYKDCCITELPIDYKKICEKNNIKLIPYSNYPFEIQELLLSKSGDGFFCYSGFNNCKIYYNDSLSEQRVYWTMIHELGHAFLYHTQDSKLANIEANFFAKYAVAPPPLINEYKINNATELGDRFNLSYYASEYAWDYYQKWLKMKSDTYEHYEQEIINCVINKKTNF